MAETGARAAAPARPDAPQPASRSPRHYRTLDYLTGHPLAVLLHRAVQGDLRGHRARSASDATLSFTPGFPMADFAECGMAVFGYGVDEKKTASGGGASCAAASPTPRRTSRWSCTCRTTRWRARARAASRARRWCSPTRRTTPAPAATATRPACCKPLIEQQRAGRGARPARSTAPAAQARARSRAGLRPRVFTLGAGRASPAIRRCEGEFTVEQLGDGSFTCTGPMFKGFRMTARQHGAAAQQGRARRARRARLAQGARPPTRRCSATSASSRARSASSR